MAKLCNGAIAWWKSGTRRAMPQAMWCLSTMRRSGSSVATCFSKAASVAPTCRDAIRQTWRKASRPNSIRCLTTWLYGQDMAGQPPLGRNGRPTRSSMAEDQAFCRVKLKVDPSPGVLRTLMDWSWASRMCLTMARPSPEPPACRERDLSTR